MTKQTEWRTWNLKGLKVTQLRFDYRFHVDMWSLQRELHVAFGTQLTWHSPTGEEQVFDPEQVASLCPLLLLLHRPMAEFAASDEGRCVLKFEDGTELRSEPHKSYEAWESHGSDDLEDASMLCGVGGGSPWG